MDIQNIFSSPSSFTSSVCTIAAISGILIIILSLLIGVLSRIFYFILLLVELIINEVRKKINKKSSTSTFVYIYCSPIFFPQSSDFLLKVIGVTIIASLAFAASNWFVYSICIIIIATLIAPLEFLEKLMAIIFSGKDFFAYLSEVSKSNAQRESQEAGLTENSSTNGTVNFSELYFYEAYYRMIFGSQLEILQLIETKNGISIDKLVEIYNKTQWLKNGYQFSEYINFLLEKTEFISLNSERNVYILTKKGEGFIEYLRKLNIPLNKDPY